MIRKFAFPILLLMAAPAWAAPSPESFAPERGHMTATPQEASGALTREDFEAHIEASASALLARTPGFEAERYVDFDVAWPHDAQEWQSMNGNAVLLIGALAQDGSELPLSRLYLTTADGMQVNLRRIGSAGRQLPQDSKSAAVFGPNLSEEFYLLPAAALEGGTQLQADFAKNREGFVITRGLTAPPTFSAVQASDAPPSAEAVRALVDRIYPGFDITLADGAP